MADKRAETMSLSGNDYAKVAERLKLFREDCPNGSIKTDFKLDGDTLIFSAYILKDKSDPNSADATGHAMGKAGQKQKDFEKLETISIGRALATLGYLASGEVASSEEMEEYQRSKKEKEQQALDEAIGLIKASEDIDALKKVFMGLGSLMANSEIIKAKDRRKLELKAEEIKKEKEAKSE